MRYAILGAGGIGCYFAARLHEAGHSVQLIARGEHLAALTQNGLDLEHPDFQFKGHLPALSLEDFLATTSPADVDVVLVTVKSMASEEVAKECIDWLSEQLPTQGPLFVSLQNGVDNEATLSRVLGLHRVAGGLTRRIGAQIKGPGKIETTGPCETLVGIYTEDLSPQVKARQSWVLQSIVNELNPANIPAWVVDDIKLELWKKLVINNGVNALAALVQLKTGVIMCDPKLSKLVMGLMRETGVAASADGVNLSVDDIQAMYDLIATFDSIKPSMLIDRERGRPLEIEDICDVVVQRSEQLGKDAPYTRTVSTLLRQAIQSDRD